MKAPLSLILLLALSSVATGQDLPDRVRGYKVHKTPIIIDGNRPGRFVIKEFSVSEISLSSVELEAVVVLTGIERSGDVETVTFQNFTINGLAFEIGEISASFQVRKGAEVKLPVPVKVRANSMAAVNALQREWASSTNKWRVKGEAYVFGKFKRLGLTFRRAVPVRVDLLIPNPLVDPTE